MSSGKTHAYALAGYTALTILFNIPLLLRIKTHVVGGFDVWSMLWIMWWAKTSLVDLHTTPFYTHLLFHPTGINLVGGLDNYVTMLISVPIYYVTGNLTLTYNLLVLLAYITSGFTTYLLVHYLTRDAQASFVSGIVFAFSPYLVNEVFSGHFNVANVEWIPLFFLFLLKTYGEDKKRNIIYGALSFLLVTVTCWYYGAYAILTILFFVDYQYIRGKLSKKQIQRIALLTALSAVLTGVILYPALSWYLETGKLVSFIPSHVTYAADVVDFLSPSMNHPLLGGITSRLYFKVHKTFPFTVAYLGLSVIALAAYALMKVCRREIGFWIILAVASIVLSLGPILKVYGEETGIPLPEVFLNLIPPFSMLRVPARITAVTMLSLAVVCGFGVKELLSKIRVEGNIYANSVFAVVCAAVLIDFLPTTPYLSDTRVSGVYSMLADMAGEDDAVLNLPGSKYTAPEYNFYQTIHGTKTIWGYVTWTAIDERHRLFADYSPVLKELAGNSGVSVINQSSYFAGRDFFSYYNITYVLIHRKLFEGYFKPLVQMSREDKMIFEESDRNLTRDNREIIEEYLNLTPFYEDDCVLAYRIPKKTQTKTFMLLDSGWIFTGERYGKNSLIVDKASVKIISPHDEETGLYFDYVGYCGESDLTLNLNDETVGVYTINVNASNESLRITTPKLKLKRGENAMEFKNSKHCDTPAKSMTIENITLTRSTHSTAD